MMTDQALLERRDEQRRLSDRLRELELAAARIVISVDQMKSTLDSRYTALQNGDVQLAARLEAMHGELLELKSLEDRLNGAWSLFLWLVGLGALAGFVGFIRSFYK